MAPQLLLHVTTCQHSCCPPATAQVLGRSEFKQLLKWRLTVRKALKEVLGGEEGKGADKGKAKGKGKAEGEGEEEAADPEEKLLQEMAAVKEGMEKRWGPAGATAGAGWHRLSWC
jgi:hypothetical protein